MHQDILQVEHERLDPADVRRVHVRQQLVARRVGVLAHLVVDKVRAVEVAVQGPRPRGRERRRRRAGARLGARVVEPLLDVLGRVARVDVAGGAGGQEAAVKERVADEAAQARKAAAAAPRARGAGRRVRGARGAAGGRGAVRAGGRGGRGGGGLHLQLLQARLGGGAEDLAAAGGAAGRMRKAGVEHALGAAAALGRAAAAAAAAAAARRLLRKRAKLLRDRGAPVSAGGCC